MTLGEKIKEKRMAEGYSVEALAEKLGISFTTLYRYEKSDIVKIPTQTFANICALLHTTPAEMMRDDSLEQAETSEDADALPTEFRNPQDAMAFMLKMPMLAAFGGYNPETMSDDTILAFANELLQQLKLVSYKYKDNGGSEK